MRPSKRKGNKHAQNEKNGKKNSRSKSRKSNYGIDEDQVWSDSNATSHKLRHKKKQRKYNDKHQVNEPEFMFKNDPYRARAMNLSKNNHDLGSGANQSILLTTLENKLNFTENIVREKIGGHNYCYSVNEVLEIIAVTCLVNFIFWFAIITCVSVMTKRERAKYRKWESMESVEIISEEDIKLHENDHYPCCLRRSMSPSEYVDDGFGNDYPTLEDDDALVRQIDGRYSFSRNSCFEDDSQDWGILYSDVSETNYWKDKPKSSVAASRSMENLLS